MFLDSKTYLPELKALLAKENSIDIAVAFWGDGAEKLLVGHRKRMRIVCNLTSGGTNPKVIKAMQDDALIEVRHLADLHAKVVIGKSNVILGSANCSANGLSLEGSEIAGWQEAGYVISNQAEIASINKWFSRQWENAEEITPTLLKQAQETWNIRCKNRILNQKNSRSILTMAPASLKGRNIVVALYRENLSDEAGKRLQEKIQEEDNKALTKSWSVFEDWNPKLLQVKQTVIDIYLGTRGAVTIGGPNKIFKFERKRRKEGENKGKMMTLHYMHRADDLMGIPSKIALSGLKERIAKKSLELLPIGSDAKVIPIEDFVTLI